MKGKVEPLTASVVLKPEVSPDKFNIPLSRLKGMAAADQRRSHLLC